MGIETEYGVGVPGKPHVNAMLLSSQVVNAYAHDVYGAARHTPRWSYEDESPLRDARGFDLTRADADPSQLTDEDIGMANVILTNGARLYVDHAHPEYSSPEITNPRDAVLWDRAGLVVLHRAAQAAARLPGGYPLRVYKNNSDNKGASYGCHENYLMSRETPFGDIVAGLTPFFISRQVITGAGRVGIGQDGAKTGFQISSRADFFEVEVGLETTVKRPIINTRDEPHADPEQYRRLHVIVGDANISETATLLKMGTTALALELVERGLLGESLLPRRPVADMHAVSHDLTLQHRIELRDGRRLTAVQLQAEFLAAASRLPDAATDQATKEIIAEWERVLAGLESDPLALADELDWVAKYTLMQQYRRRDGLQWGSSRLQLIDLQYADADPDRGVGLQLERRGRLRRLTDPAEVERAVTTAPADTRAWFRGECMRRYSAEVAAAGWDSVVFDLPGRHALQRVPTLDPLRGTEAHVGSLLARSATATDLVDALTG
jgi:proteasome accessory factor PafA2